MWRDLTSRDVMWSDVTWHYIHKYVYIYIIHIFYIYSCVLHTNDVHDVEIDTEQNKDLQHVTLPSLYPCLSGAHGRSLIHLIFVVNALRISAWSISENGHHKIAERMPSVAQKLRFLSNGGTLPKKLPLNATQVSTSTSMCGLWACILRCIQTSARCQDVYPLGLLLPKENRIIPQLVQDAFKAAA